MIIHLATKATSVTEMLLLATTHIKEGISNLLLCAGCALRIA